MSLILTIISSAMAGSYIHDGEYGLALCFILIAINFIRQD